MSTWRIPAKTFLIGEYLALDAGPAILLTTTPCFELSLVDEGSLPFHPQSPAGRFCLDHQLEYCLAWRDPYLGLGGLGASSAEFVACFYAYCEMMKRSVDREVLLETYWAYAWSKSGKKPSGYDVIAQTMDHCVMLHRAEGEALACTWPFQDITFILVHTQHKLATHQHLKESHFEAQQASSLYDIAKRAWVAFKTASSEALVAAVNEYATALAQMGLVANTTLAMMQTLTQEIRPLAIKGCGAMGSDVVLILVEQARSEAVRLSLKEKNYTVLASLEELHADNDLKCEKTLEI